MKDNILGVLQTIGLWVVIIIVFVILAALIGIEIYAWVVYGGKPVTEIPAWVLWLMWGK